MGRPQLNAIDYTYVSNGTQGHDPIAAGKDMRRAETAYLHNSTFTLTLRGRL